MKKLSTYFTLILIHISIISFSQTNNEIPWDISQNKIKNTYTLNVNNNTSLHAIASINKEVKKLEFNLFLKSPEGVKNLKSFFLDKNCNIVSTHLNNGNFVLTYKIFANGNEQYEVIQYHLESETLSTNKVISSLKYLTPYTTSNSTLFIKIYIQGGKILINEIKNIDEVYVNSYTFEDKTFLSYLQNQLFINDLSFSYLDPKELQESQIQSTTSLFKNSDQSYTLLLKDSGNKIYYSTIDPSTDKNTLKFKTLEAPQLNKFKSASLIQDSYIFQFSTQNEQAELSIYSINQDSIYKSYHYTKDVFGPYHKYYKDSIPSVLNPEDFFKPDKGDFFKLNKKLNANTYPFIVVNKDKNDNYIVEAGYYRLSNEIDYFNNNMLNNMNTFNSPINKSIYTVSLLNKDEDEDDKKNFFIVCLNKDLEVIEKNEIHSIHTYIWKKTMEDKKKFNSQVKVYDVLRYTEFDGEKKSIILGSKSAINNL